MSSNDVPLHHITSQLPARVTFITHLQQVAGRSTVQRRPQSLTVNYRRQDHRPAAAS